MVGCKSFSLSVLKIRGASFKTFPVKKLFAQGDHVHFLKACTTTFCLEWSRSPRLWSRCSTTTTSFGNRQAQVATTTASRSSPSSTRNSSWSTSMEQTMGRLRTKENPLDRPFWVPRWMCSQRKGNHQSSKSSAFPTSFQTTIWDFNFVQIYL